MRAPVFPLLLAAGFVLTACSEAPTGPGEADAGGPAVAAATGTDASPLDQAARRISRIQSFDFSDVDDRCSNGDPDHEPILLEGTFTQHVHRVWTDSDHWNYIANYEIDGQGTGMISGASYRLHGQGTYGEHFGPVAGGDVPVILREVSTFNIIGQGGAPNQQEKYQFNVTVNADGDLVVLEETFELSCQ